MNNEKIICFEKGAQQDEMFIANETRTVVFSEKCFSFCRFPRSFTISFEPNQDPREFPYKSQEPDLSFYSHLQQKQSSRVSSCRRTRIKWTEDLHDKFVESVNLLGGAEKATPMGILKLMGSDSKGLTVFQVKSHLQKYRISECLPDTSAGNSEKKGNAEELSQHDFTTEMQFKDALQLQLDIQKHLREQLEIQRNLQLRIEEQGRQLKIMLEQQQKTKKRLIMDRRMDQTFPHFDYSSPFAIEEVEEIFAEIYRDNPR